MGAVRVRIEADSEIVLRRALAKALDAFGGVLAPEPEFHDIVSVALEIQAMARADLGEAYKENPLRGMLEAVVQICVAMSAVPSGSRAVAAQVALAANSLGAAEVLLSPGQASLFGAASAKVRDSNLKRLGALKTHQKRTEWHEAALKIFHEEGAKGVRNHSAISRRIKSEVPSAPQQGDGVLKQIRKWKRALKPGIC